MQALKNKHGALFVAVYLDKRGFMSGTRRNSIFTPPARLRLCGKMLGNIQNDYLRFCLGPQSQSAAPSRTAG